MSKFLTEPPKVTAWPSVSIFLSEAIPELPLRMLRQASVIVLPTGQTIPKPVITTLLFLHMMLVCLSNVAKKFFLNRVY